MDDPKWREQVQHFIEEVGLVFAHWSLPRMAGRILGWLMVCDPRHQSAAQLAEVTGASKGSISTATRMLVQLGLAERIGMPGERSSYYRLVKDPGMTLLGQKIAAVQLMRSVAERGLGILAHKSPGQRERLQQMHDMWSFFERELPILMERYDREQRGESEEPS